jgi:hypothetical protein
MQNEPKVPQWIVDVSAAIADKHASGNPYLQADIIRAMQDAGREVAFYFAATPKREFVAGMPPEPSSATVPSDEHLIKLSQMLWEQGHISDLSRDTAVIFGRAVLALAAPAAQPRPLGYGGPRSLMSDAPAVLYGGDERRHIICLCPDCASKPAAQSADAVPCGDGCKGCGICEGDPERCDPHDCGDATPRAD